MADMDLEGLRDDTRTAWHQFIDTTAAFRPDLFRYCRKLTGSVWDAEDLVQDTLVRAFSTLGSLHQNIESPRAYLIRIASNIWIDQLRRHDREAAVLADAWLLDPSNQATPQDARAEAADAAATLLTHLAPQEKAALLLKEIFGLSLKEIAQVLTTSEGAVKAALHRARSGLSHLPEMPRPTHQPSRHLVQTFVDRLAAADMEGLLELMHENGTVEYHGCLIESGKDEYGRKGSWFDRACNGHPDWPDNLQPPRSRPALGDIDGEPVVFSFNDYGEGEIIDAALRFECFGGKIVRMHSYGTCPEVLAEIAQQDHFAVGPPFYRFPTPEPGKYWADAL